MSGAPPANAPIQPQSSQPRAIEPSHFTRESDLPLKPASGISNSQPLQPTYKSNKRPPWPTPCHIWLIRSFFFPLFKKRSYSKLKANRSVTSVRTWQGATKMDGLCQRRHEGAPIRRDSFVVHPRVAQFRSARAAKEINQYIPISNDPICK